MLNFRVKVLQRCPKLDLLTTTRGSLEFITLRVQEFDSLKLKPLDAQPSASLIVKLSPQQTTADLQANIKQDISKRRDISKYEECVEMFH